MKTALIFPGQGSQIVGMGKDLYEKYSCAKDVFQKVDDVLSQKLSRIIFEGPSEELTQTQNTQPALMAVSMALISVIENEYGKNLEDIASYVAGHSLGEYSALCAAKAISLEETAKLLQVRGSEMAKCGQETSGAMAAILGVDISTAQEIAQEARGENLGEESICQVANDNSIGQVVLSGSKMAIERSLKIAKEKGAKRAVMLPVSGAFHCELMKNAAKAMSEMLSKTEISAPKLPLIANVNAQVIIDPEQIKDLLVQQVTGAVRWRESMLALEENGVERVIEIGSGKVLSGLAPRTCKNIDAVSIQNSEDLKNFFS